MIRSANFVLPIFVVVDRVVEEEETVVPRANFAELERETADTKVKINAKRMAIHVIRKGRLLVLIIKGSPAFSIFSSPIIMEQKWIRVK